MIQTVFNAILFEIETLESQVRKWPCTRSSAARDVCERAAEACAGIFARPLFAPTSFTGPQKGSAQNIIFKSLKSDLKVTQK